MDIWLFTYENAQKLLPPELLMHQIVFHRAYWGSLQRSPRLPSWFMGREEEKERGEGRGGEKEGGQGAPEFPNAELAKLHFCTVVHK